MMNDPRPELPAPRLGIILAAIAGDLLQMMRFYSRLPVPDMPGEQDPHRVPDFTRAPRTLAIAGALIALPAGLCLMTLSTIGTSPLISAVLAIAVLVASTGAFHEDGLADCADGLGGHEPQRRLDIMKDSRIGTFGGVALVLSLALRVAALTEITNSLGALSAATLLCGSAGLSRALGLLPLTLLPPARPGGFAAGVGRPSRNTLLIAIGTGLMMHVGGGVMAAAPLGALLLGPLVASLAVLAVMRQARRLIGGQTGDVAGATQQLAEIALLVTITIYLPKS